MTPAPLMALVRELRETKRKLYLPNQYEYNGYATACEDNADKLEAALKAWAEQDWATLFGVGPNGERYIRERVLGVEEHGQSETHS